MFIVYFSFYYCWIIVYICKLFYNNIIDQILYAVLHQYEIPAKLWETAGEETIEILLKKVKTIYREVI